MVLLVLILGCSVRPEAEAPVARGPRAVRVVVDPDETRLEVASRTLAREDRAVRLVGMVHVGDPAFYAAVGELLRGSDAVLLEGLAPEQAGPADAAAAEEPPDVGVLGLASQSDALPRQEGWRRSDLSVAGVRAALLARGVDPGPWLDDRDRGALRELLAAAVDERTRSLARLALLSGLAGDPPADDAYWEVIVGRRDAAVVADAGDEPGSVAVVYGADHLPDLEARLLARGFRRVDERWLAAVTVSHAGLGLGPVQVRQLLR